MVEKTTDQLFAMFVQPDHWIPEALEAAKIELRRRDIAENTMVMLGKTTDQLVAMFQRPGNCLPQALDAARAELRRRGIDAKTIRRIPRITNSTKLVLESMSTATDAINAFGIDLLRTIGKPGVNALLSPYSLQSALAMAYAGAEGDTRAEMAKVLHYPEDDARLHGAFAALRQALDDVVQESAWEVELRKQWGAPNDPITLAVANRLFAQQGYEFREAFLALLIDSYAAPLERLDFVRDPAGATKHINAWVEDQTWQRIRNVISADALDNLTKLVLVNAMYLKAPWAEDFMEGSTQPRPFHAAGGKPVDVPTMMGARNVGYAKRDGCSIVTIPYHGDDLQFLILLPDKEDGLAGLEKTLTPDLLAEGSSVPRQEVILYLPKFKVEPPVMSLGDDLQALGMRTAFDVPQGSANFDRMAPRRPEGYLAISKVFHNTFLKLNEHGTEAAAATVMEVVSLGGGKAEPSIEVRVDRPFIFAIQHRASAACLFLGHITDPR